MGKQKAILGERPPSYPSKATLARELDISEATVDNWVQKGILPQPIPCGATPRWCWAQVQEAMARRIATETDPFIEGLKNVG